MTDALANPPEFFTQNSHGEQYLYSVNRNAFISKSAEEVFDKYYEDELWQEQKFNVISGCDSGLLLLYVYYRGVPADSKFLFVEQPHVIEAIKQLIDLSQLGENIVVETLDNWYDKAHEMKIETYLYSANVAYHRSIGSVDDFDDQYHAMHLSILENIETLTFQQNSSLGNQFFTESQLNNLTENYYSAIPLMGAFEGQTAVVIGGGPSLDESIDWMKANREKIVILAVSRVAKRLKETDLIPDIVFSVDPFTPSYDVSKELLTLPSSVLFVYNNNANNRLVHQWHGRKAYLGLLFPWETKLNEKNMTGMGPTVTNTALNCAIGFGFSKILLTGVDLCYSKTGVSHASGSEEAKHGAALHHDGLWVETYAGDLVETTIPYHQAAKVIEAQAEKATSIGSRVFNLSINATKLDSIPYQAPDEIELSDISIDVKELTHQFSCSWQKNKKHVAQTQSELQQKQGDITEIRKLAKSALQLNAALYDNTLSEEKKAKSKLQLDKIEQKLDKKYASASELCKRYGMKYFIKVVTPQSHENWTDDKMKELGALYYQAYIDSCDLLSELFFKIKKHISLRKDELGLKKSIVESIEHWRETKTLGRAKLFKSFISQGELDATSEMEELLNNAEQEFIEELEGKTTFQFIAAQENVKFHPHLLKRKIRRLHSQKHVDGLKLLIENLKAKSDDEPGWHQMSLIAQACIANINKQGLLAISLFESVDDKFIDEDELRIMARLYLANAQPEKAESALLRLTSLNKLYGIQLAKISTLHEKPEQAIHAYYDYIEVKGNDIEAIEALHKLLIENNKTAEAQNVLEHLTAIMGSA
ncbi:6-hydroxymethylpterin diphosphokinase MptE-like protein [Thalassotalea euphylliae]|uniref:6-hydroxymethylpterin diphosphokinase MptE-like protein n=1 Tax=Thalassotalea euphylliae TaxID=1655234 RepID=UPI00362640DE